MMKAKKMAKILIIEDDAAISDVVSSTLVSEGYECTTAYSGSEAKLLLATAAAQSDRFPFDLVICDLMLPGLSGEEIISIIRKTTSVPILVMSAKAEVKDRVTLLRQGVDDYLVKPFDLDELVARVEALLRRASFTQVDIADDRKNYGKETNLEQCATQGLSEADETLTFGAWVLSGSQRRFEANGVLVRLTRTEFDIVATLMRHPRKVFTKRELYEAAWHEEALVEEKAINTHISNIRSKLKETGTDHYIETAWGIGFKLADL